MAGSSFGNLFRITTWGESHGKGIGVVVESLTAVLRGFLSQKKISRNF